jgi:hypothetical protein
LKSRILIVLAIFMLFSIPTCMQKFPRYGVDVALAYQSHGPSISIDDVNYIPGENNAAEDQTEVTIYGSGWSSCERVWVYVNGMRNTVFDPASTDWTVTVHFAAIRTECSIQVEGAQSGWSNVCYFNGSTVGPQIATLQPSLNAGVVGTEVGLAAINWYPPRGLITIYFGPLAVGRVYPAQTWQSTFVVPEHPAGICTVIVQDETTVKTFDFKIIPAMAIEPSEVSAGQLMTIKGTGFAASHYVHIMPTDKLVYTDSNGSFRVEGIKVASAAPFSLQGLDENDNCAYLNITPKGSGANDPTVPGYPTVVTIPSTIPSVSPYVILASIGGLLILAIVIIALLVRRKTRVS